MKNNMSKIVIIVVCAICVCAVTVAKIVDGNKKKEKANVEATITPASNAPTTTPEVITPSIEPTVSPEVIEPTPSIEADINIEDYYDPEQNENLDESLYDENASDNYMPGVIGYHDQEYTITNASILDDLSTDQRSYFDEKLLYFLNNFIEDEVKEITILEDSYNFDKTSAELVLKADLDNNKRIRVKIYFNDDRSSIGEIIKQ